MNINAFFQSHFNIANITVITSDGYDTALKIKPPLTFTIGACEILAEAIEAVLRDIHQK